MAKDKLTAKQNKFIQEYLVDLNITQAAIRAGYSKKTAEVIGFENLRKPYIAAEIQKAMKALEERTQITQEWVLKRLTDISNKCFQAEPVLNKEGQGSKVIALQITNLKKMRHMRKGIYRGGRCNGM